jgi:hypothetical protein
MSLIADATHSSCSAPNSITNCGISDLFQLSANSYCPENGVTANNPVSQKCTSFRAGFELALC